MRDTDNALAALRAHLVAHPPLCDQLAAILDFGAFVTAVRQIAGDAGIALSCDVIATASRGDPLGLDRFHPLPATQAQWPDPAWLPAAIGSDGAQPVVVWRHFAGLTLDRPFFADTLRQADARWLNRLVSMRTPLSALASAMPAAEDRAPAGLIFHMSRCGSTLVAQMLAALPGTIMLSEPAPFDEVLQIAQHTPDLPFEARVAMLRAMAAALGRARFGEHERYALKLDSWHALALPLLRAAFPDTPWIFLFRDPTEVMVSQMAQRGSQTVPGLLDPRIFGIAAEDAMGLTEEDYCAFVLAKVCTAALDGFAAGGGLLLDYAELPGSVETHILPHFGIAPDAAGLAAMRAASERDAKMPGARFTRDVERKQVAATDAVRAAVAGRLEAPWRRLRARAVSSPFALSLSKGTSLQGSGSPAEGGASTGSARTELG